ncbi:hypothetical protein LQ50_10585 [Halalkalibacter okhensis]|uniref:Group-specific protein n=2 Tax=Halalkalibacter okhensis TaxID=333138 RepID=A0A0B0IKI1_9BACI|nr:hypothetical protein LQ50_10585 [Halalkalibacter okhensis]
MFDPTIFENLKVGIENYIYDLETIEQVVQITNRKDQVDMSIMSRHFGLEFHLANKNKVTAEIILDASIKDLAEEILEAPAGNPGCRLLLQFTLQIEEIQTQCEQIETILLSIWAPILPPEQTISFVYGKKENKYMNSSKVMFDHKINEEHMEDIPEFVDHVLETLRALNNVN